MNDREKWQERVRDIRASGIDDDDDDDDDDSRKNCRFSNQFYYRN